MEPLANKIRPTTLKEFVGQEHLVGKGKPFREAIEKGHLFSFVLWGPPGSGKTMIMKSFAQRVGAAYICPDDIRVEFGLRADDQSRNREVWEEVYWRVYENSALFEHFVIDATNARASDRVRLIQHCRQFADCVKGVWFVTPLEECKRRNKLRERQVPGWAIERMYRTLEQEPPDESEGFNEIIIIIPTHNSSKQKI